MSETDFLKLKKHDNVETNTEKFDIENYLNGNWDKINENAKKVNTDISNINSKNKEQDTNIEQLQENTETSSNKIAELEKELKEAQEDFYQNSIRGQASGEYIHVEDSSNCRAKIGIGGNSEQETSTQGRNYFTGNKIEGGTNLGATYSFDNSILKLNGTTTNKGNILEKISTKVILPPGNYKFRAGLYAGSFERNSKDMAIYLSNKEDFLNGAYVSSGITLSSLGSVGSFTITENTELYVSIFVNGAGLVLNNTQLAILIAKAEKDENIGTFEQFTPDMPSPNYPSEVKSCGDNVNLFDKDNANILDNAFLNTTDKIITSFTGRKSFYIKIKPNTTYTISRKIIASVFSAGTTEDIPTVNSTLIDVAYNNNGKEMTIITSSNAKYLTIYYKRDIDTSTDEEILDSIKIQKGTTPTPYSPYGQGCINEVICNKNLFDKKNANILNAIINGTTKEIGSFNTCRSIYIACDKNEDYSISRKSGTRFVVGTTTDLPVVGTICNQIVKNNTGNSITITTTNADNYLVVFYYNSESDTLTEEEILNSIQIEKGSEATEKVEHQEQVFTIPTQQPMRAIGDVRDTFIKKNNKWYERHYIARKIFDGTEVWVIQGTNLYNVENILPNHIATNYIKAIQSNYYLGVQTRPTNADFLNFVSNYDFACCLHPNGTTMRFKDTRNLDLSTFKSWLSEQYNAGTPVYVDYILETPNDIECTEEQSKILDELNNARTYKNVTNITTDSKAILSLDYVKDQETQNQKMQNEIDEIKQLLSTTQTSAMLLDNLQKEVESEVE